MIARDYKDAAIFALVYSLFIIALYAVYLELFTRRKVPKNLPLAGFGNEFFNWSSRASFRQVFASPDTAEQGYRQVCAHSYFIPPLSPIKSRPE
jgi:hypothetical protein